MWNTAMKSHLGLFTVFSLLVSAFFLIAPVNRPPGPIQAVTPRPVPTPRPIPLESVHVPNDAVSNCHLSNDAIADWFKTGHIRRGGAVTPADGLTFPTQPSECDYYAWALRMFLWATSPTPAYGSRARVFESSAFYDVSPADSSGHRKLIAHVPGQLLLMSLRGGKPDHNGLQIIFSQSGQPLEVQTAPVGPHSLPLVANEQGQQVEIGSVTSGANGTPVFRDRDGNIVSGPKPVLSPVLSPNLANAPPTLGGQSATPLPVAKISVNGATIYLDGSGNSVPVESGQADGGVLEAQNGSLVYYAIMVNDVYAYFLTGQKTQRLLATQFPTSESDVDGITKLVSAHHETLSNPKALAIELKTSWVDASSLEKPGDFITIAATVPDYDRSHPKRWVQRGTKTKTLALVGMHVVGSVRGHPDMVWSTFEHVSNAPNGKYTYQSDRYKTVTPDTTGNWLFCCTRKDGPFNQAHMTQVGSDIEASGSFDISPSDTMREKAWGTPSNTSNAPVANAQVIKLNSDVMHALAADDVRHKYFLLGAMWTTNANAPGVRNVGGSQSLANATLETYVQGRDTTNFQAFPCFGCHSATTTDLLQMSHIFPVTQPLFGKSIAATPRQTTFQPSQSLTRVSWSTSTYSSPGCQGGSDHYFQDATSEWGSAFTAFFAVAGINTTTQPSGRFFQNGLYAGLEAAGMQYGCYTAKLIANAATLFDVKSLKKHAIVTATLTLTGARTLTYGGYNGMMAVIKGGFCPISVAPATNPWWREPHAKLQFHNGNFLVYTYYPSGSSGTGYGGSNRLSIDVTKLVNDWQSHDFSNNNGFVVLSAVNGPRALQYSTACVTEFTPTLKVVYF